MGHLVGADTWAAAIAVIGPIIVGIVDSIFGRTGVVVAVDDDYDASQVENTPAGSITATDVQAAINELDTEKAALASPTFTGLLTAPTTQINGPATLQIDGIGEGITDGSEDFVFLNITPAAVGAQQYSPALRFLGSGWKTDAVAASQSVEFRRYVKIVQGAAGPVGSLTTEASINGGAYQGVHAIDSDGNVGFNTAEPIGNLDIGGNILIDSVPAFPNADTYVMLLKTDGGGVAPFDEAGSFIYRTRVSAVAGRSSHLFYTGSPAALALTINELQNAIFTGTLAAPTASLGVLSAATTDITGSLKVSAGIVDAGDDEMLDFKEAAVPVNNFQISNATTGSGPSLAAVGGDPNIDVNANPKGTGVFKVSGVTTLTHDEFATEAEVFTGTATLKVVSPAELKPREPFMFALGNETTEIVAGNKKITWRMPYAFELSGIRLSAVSAPTGSLLTVDVNEAGSTILSTKLTIDATEKTSETAAAAPVISDSTLADDAEMTADIDGIGSTFGGAGLKLTLIGNRT